MKVLLIITIFIALVSCNHSPAQEGEKQHPPVVAQAKGGDVTLVDTRSGGIVESMYKEIVDKTPYLKQLEAQIQVLEETKSDSTKAFDDFNNSNNAYYASAGAYASGIKDSLLREQIKLMLTQSQKAYVDKTAQFNKLKDMIDSKSATLSGLHILLKLTKTMGAMEDYQNAYTPTVKPMQNVLKGYNAAISKIAQLVKK